MQSKLTIGVTSTLLREAFGLEKKILACCWSGYPSQKFPIEDICTLPKMSYESFEKQVLKILLMPEKEYFNILKNKINFVMPSCKNTSNILRIKIDKFLNSENSKLIE
jgi:hypothetical protein